MLSRIASVCISLQDDPANVIISDRHSSVQSDFSF